MYKKYFKGKKAILLDLDGTLIRSHTIWDSACAVAAYRNDLVWRGLNFLIAPTIKEAWKSYLKFINRPLTNLDSLVEETEKIFLYFVHQVPPEDLLMPGALDFIHTLYFERGLKFALVTNSSTAVANDVLNYLNLLQVFTAVLGRDSVSKPKPAPDIYKKALTDLGVPARDSLAIEDSPGSIQAARKAGLQVLGIRNPLFFDSEYPAKTLVVPDFTELVAGMDKSPEDYFGLASSSISDESDAVDTPGAQ